MTEDEIIRKALIARIRELDCQLTAEKALVETMMAALKSEDSNENKAGEAGRERR